MDPQLRSAVLAAIDAAIADDPEDVHAALTDRPEGWTVSTYAYAAALEFGVCPSQLQAILDNPATRCAVALDSLN